MAPALCAMMRMRRRSTISARAPAMMASVKAGSALATCTNATMSGELDRLVISHPAATFCSQVPMLEATLAIHSARNSGWRSGAQAPEGEAVEVADMTDVQQARYVTRCAQRVCAGALHRAALACLVLALGTAAARAEALRNWFNDQFAQATHGLAGCPEPLGPLMTEADARRQAHPRIERGNSCYLAGQCDSPNAYKDDAVINAAVVAALAQDARLRKSAIWVTTQRKFVFLQGCVAERGMVERAVLLARSIHGVAYVGDELLIGTRGKPPYALRATKN